MLEHDADVAPLGTNVFHGTPLILMVPEVGAIRPAIRCRTVVFPEPDGPSSVMN